MSSIQQMKAEGAAPSAEAALSDIADLIEMTFNDEMTDTGAAPQSEKRGVLRPKRETCDTEAPSPKAVRVKQEEEGDVGGTPVKARSDSLFSPAGKRRVKGVAPNDADIPVPCEGCNRIRGVSPDFLVVGETCAWAHPNGKGCWCRDCEKIWRTNFQHSHALAFFPAWLRKAPENRVAFAEVLLAHLSLVWEENNRITREQVQARVNMFQWLWSVVDFNPFKGLNTEGFIRMWLVRLSGVAPSSAIIKPEAITIGLEEDVASPFRSKTRLAKRLHGWIPQGQQLLGCFAQSSWVELNESQFTKLVGIMSLLYTECGHTGEDAETTLLATDWSEGLQAAKTFIKAMASCLWFNGVCCNEWLCLACV